MKIPHTKLILIASFFICLNAYAQEEPSNRNIAIPASQADIQLLDSTINLYKAGDFYISGQPSDSILMALKNEGLKLIINVRTPEEMAILKENGFDEEAISDSLNTRYVNVPMGGDFGFTQKAIQDISVAIQQSDGKVMIHCRRAGRATNAWMAWLINYYNVPVDDAISLGKQMQFSLYLEDLLGYDLSFDKK